MVSLWPFKHGDSKRTPASFEKVLSALSGKIVKATSRLDSVRQRSRRLQALWTLYSSFAYLLYLMIMSLVIGWQNWNIIEYTAAAGGPLVIYLVRLGLTTYYDYRISTLQSHVDALHKQRDATIDELKAATKFNTTQELLEKYGGAPPKPKRASSGRRSGSDSNRPTPPEKRTGYAPPPTANISGRAPASPSMPMPSPLRGDRMAPASPAMPMSSPLRGGRMAPPSLRGAPSLPGSPMIQWFPPQDSPMLPGAEFAPNAFSPVRQHDEVSHWYDRLLDVLLGEDESSPGNRIALICRKCRLVNGQAPPGAKSLADVGRWRCASCGTMNGAESEAKEIMAGIRNQVAKGGGSDAGTAGFESGPASPAVSVDTREAPADARARRFDDSETDVTQYSEEDRDASPRRAPSAKN